MTELKLGKYEHYKGKQRVFVKNVLPVTIVWENHIAK